MANQGAIPQRSRVPRARWIAVGFVLYIAVALVVSWLAASMLSQRQERFALSVVDLSQYMASGGAPLRLIVLSSAIIVLSVAIAVLFIPRRKGVEGQAGASGSIALADSALCIAIHAVAIATSTLIVGIVAVASPILLQNPRIPGSVVSLDVAMLTSLRSYVIVILYELVWAQRALQDGRVALGNSATLPASQPPRLVFRGWSPAILIFCDLVLVISRPFARMVVSYNSAVIIGVVGIISSLPSVAEWVFLLWQLSMESPVPAMRSLGAVYTLTAVVVYVVTVTLQGTVRYSTPVSIGDLRIDAIVCASAVPGTVLGLAANAIVGHFAGELSSESLHAVAAAHMRVAESRKQLLRWLAHEARVPLNSLYIGLQLLNDPASAVRAALGSDHDEVTTLGLCGSAAEGLLAVV